MWLPSSLRLPEKKKKNSLHGFSPSVSVVFQRSPRSFPMQDLPSQPRQLQLRLVNPLRPDQWQPLSSNNCSKAYFVNAFCLGLWYVLLQVICARKIKQRNICQKQILMGRKGAKNVTVLTDLVTAQNIHHNSHVTPNSHGLIRELAAMLLPSQPSASQSPY